MANKKRRAWPEKYERDIEKIIADYIAETGDKDWTRDKVAAWAIQNGRWQQEKANAAKELARVISRVAGRATFLDEEGNEVRKYHSWRLECDQPRLWSSIDTITRDHMMQSINDRRDKLVDGAVRVIT